jgi:quercetin dioxygenase-like cupin family protein/DNA-binding XRE family transcriptional regulator
MSNTEKIGPRIQTYRRKLEMSIEELSDRTGLQSSLIEDIEDSRVSPAIGVMVKLSRALGQRVGTFMDDQIARDPVITRSAEREEGIASHKGDTQGHYRYHSLGTGKADRHMEPFYINISPTEVRESSSHEGEEFVVVMSGEVELQYGKETYVLKEGDTMYYNSLVPHCLSAVGGDAKIYAVIFTL